MNYETLYHRLFNDITKIIFDYENQPSEIIERLKQIQVDAEDRYLDMCDEIYPNGEDLGDNEDSEDED